MSAKRVTEAKVEVTLTRGEAEVLVRYLATCSLPLKGYGPMLAAVRKLEAALIAAGDAQ